MQIVTNSLVLTNKGYKYIDDIVIDDLIYDADYQLHSIKKIQMQYNYFYYELSAFGCENIAISETQQFLTRNKQKIWNNNDRKYIRKFKKQQWLNINDIDKDIYLGLSLNPLAIVPTWKGIDVTINQFCKKNVNTLDLYDPDFWYIIGRYLGDGWLRKQYKKGFNRQYYSGIVICCGKHEVDDLKSKISDKYKYTLNEEKTTFRFTFNNVEMAAFLKQFGIGAQNKFLPDFVLNLPIDLLESLLIGYFDSDGCYEKDSSYIHYTSISKQLAYGISLCINKVYKKPCSINFIQQKQKKKIDNRIVNQQHFYTGRFNQDDSKFKKAFYENNYIWYPIRKIKAINNKKLFYNIDIDNCSSIIINGCIVKC